MNYGRWKMEDGRCVRFEAHGNFIEFHQINRPFPDAEANWDRDAIDAIVTVSAGPFGGEFKTTLWSHELIFLLKLLRSLDKNIGQEAEETFKFREGTVQLTFSTTKKGNVQIFCEACEYPADDTELTFSIGADQSYLSLWIEQIEMALKDFPLVMKLRD